MDRDIKELRLFLETLYALIEAAEDRLAKLEQRLRDKDGGGREEKACNSPQSRNKH